ncbi:unnamed protein product, partial [Gulo gulo]
MKISYQVINLQWLNQGHTSPPMNISSALVIKPRTFISTAKAPCFFCFFLESKARFIDIQSSQGGRGSE